MSNDRFSAPKPRFIQPSKALIPTDGSFRSEKGAAPAIPLAKLPALNLPVFGTGKRTEAKVRAGKETSTPASIQRGPVVRFGPEHIVSDEDFILRTRAHSIHDVGMKELFYANGGLESEAQYDTLANAFDALRRTKAARVAGALDGITSETPAYTRHQTFASHEIEIFVPGTVRDAHIIRERAREAATQRNQTEAWLHAPIKKVG